MKTIEELQKEKETKDLRKQYLCNQRDILQYEIDSLKSEIDEINSQIENFEQYQKKCLEKERDKAILQWLTGQNKKSRNVGWFKGIIDLTMDLYYFKEDNCTLPKGTKEEIIAIMKQYNCTYLRICTYHHSFFGDDVTNIEIE